MNLIVVTITPGYQFQNGEGIDYSKLNRLGQPTFSVAVDLLTFDTVALLRESTNLVNRNTATVLGGAAIGDGDGGFYYYDAASSATDDGASVVKPNSILTANPGRWIRWKS